MPFNLTVLGCSSATPTADRHPSAQILEIEDQLILIDCGEATQNQLLRYKIRYGRIRHIFISHLHGDHYLGLIGLLSTMSIQGRTDQLNIFAPAALEAIIRIHLEASRSFLNFPLNFHPLQADSVNKILVQEHFEVHSFPLEHRIPTCGFLFRELNPLRKLNIEECNRWNVPISSYRSIKEGHDFITPEGQVIGNRSLSFDSRKGRSYAYCSDTIYTESFLELIRDVDVLYHEATFMHNLLDRAKETLHTTSLQAGMLAAKANAGTLIIGHYSARYSDINLLLEEARSVFDNSLAAIEGQVYPIE